MAKLNFMINQKNIQLADLAILGIIWLGSAISDRIWFAFDHSVPAWDQAGFITTTADNFITIRTNGDRRNIPALFRNYNRKSLALRFCTNCRSRIAK